MKVTGVELYSNDSNIINFSMSDVATNDKYLIKTIIGLDADEIVRKFYSFSKDQSVKFYNFNLVKRELVFRIQLNPNYYINEDFSEIRDEIYRSISSNRSGLINILFKSGGSAVAQISGYFTRFEVPYFSRVPEIQIHFNCEDFLLRGYSPVELLTADLGTTNHIYVSDSISTAPHGMSMKVTYTGASASFKIQDDPTTPNWEFKVEPIGGFLTGDVLFIESEYASKAVYIIRSGVTIPIMDAVTNTSIWPIIFPGSNEFYTYYQSAFTYNYVSYYPAYWGI